MTDDSFIREAYSATLGRDPSETEIARWATTPPSTLLKLLRESAEFRRKRGPQTFVPPGHYYSPIVDPKQLGDYYRRQRNVDLDALKGIHIDVDEMVSLWRRWLPTVVTGVFESSKSERARFYLNNGFFPLGDAVALRAIIAECKPRRIVEIGSGYSTACMLDALDEFGLQSTELTCIEPYPERLKSLLKSEDFARIQVLETPVQEAPLPLFQSLTSGDLVFIDSTHVLKTGSDVHFELFHVMPSLSPGVMIHFHDCPFPFEYGPKWVLQDNMSWNEVYAVRAFLMYNNNFRVRFWSALLARTRLDVFEGQMEEMVRSPGSGLWIERV